MFIGVNIAMTNEFNLKITMNSGLLKSNWVQVCQRVRNLIYE